MRRSLPLLVVAAALSVSMPALADNPNCPPGAWFCADVVVPAPAAPPVAPQEPVAPARPQQMAPRPPPPPQAVQVEEDAPPAPPPVRRLRPPPPPVVIYQPVPSAPPPQVIIITPGYGYGYGYGYAPQPRPAPAPPPPAQPRWHSEWGFDMRVEGVALGKPGGGAFNAGLGGVGMSLRYRPVPHFAFDLGVDLLAGTDYNGFSRTEVPVSLSGMLFFNPKSRAQFYLIAGANVSRAQVRSDTPCAQGATSGCTALLSPVDGGSQYGATYTYFGGQGGGGFEFRLSRRVALDLDVVGFVRERIGNIQQPEFVDPATGNTTNVSGGALGRFGLVFWW
jgi:hypothetical protein